MMRIPPSGNEMVAFAGVLSRSLASRAKGGYHEGDWQVEGARNPNEPADLYFRTVRVLATWAGLLIYGANRLSDD
jgi:hypothetical protein